MWQFNPVAFWFVFSTIIVACSLVVFYLYKQNYFYRHRSNQTHLNTAVNASGDQLWEWNIKKQKIRCLNAPIFQHFPLDGIRSSHSPLRVHPDDLVRLSQALNEHLAGKTKVFEATYRVQTNQGVWYWILDRGKAFKRDKQNNALYMAGSLKDISELYQAQEKAWLFANSFKNISDGICIYDKDFQAIEINDAYTKITGRTRQETLLQNFKLPLYAPEYQLHIKSQLALYKTWRGELDDLRASGERFTMDVSIDEIRNDNGSEVYYVMCFADISERRATESELRRLANTDTLTGLPNRSYFQVSHSNLVRKSIPHALFVFDLDNFKKINDSLSHEVGDLLLCLVAERISSLLNHRDSLFRLGGDEFAVVLEKSPKVREVAAVAKKLVASLHEPFYIESHEFVINCSLGAVLYPTDGDSSNELLQNADTAMYHAKSRGGNSYQFYNEQMNEKVVQRFHLENQVRQALKNKLVEVHYQPKINLVTQQVAGLEALARIHDPEQGYLNPAQFIPLAEETGMILELGEQVLMQACEDAKKWLTQGLFQGRIAVNLSARQFNQKNFVEDIKRILDQTGVPASALELEITESMVMHQPEQAIKIMTQLQSLGFHLALDDFGTGYSSLAYLKRFPIHCLKIDKAFIDDIHTSTRDKNMVASILSMAHNLGLHVVAEGVEAAEQVHLLRQLQCEAVQGYYFSRPLAAPALEDFIKTANLAKQFE